MTPDYSIQKEDVTLLGTNLIGFTILVAAFTDAVSSEGNNTVLMSIKSNQMNTRKLSLSFIFSFTIQKTGTAHTTKIKRLLNGHEHTLTRKHVT